MFHRPPPPPVERKPTLSLTFYSCPHEVPGLPSFDEATQDLLALAGAADKIDAVAYAQLEAGGDLLLAAIDPVTGDSVVHRAAAAGNLNALDAIRRSFGKNLSQRPATERLLWLLVTHQNLVGDTALHAAARAGSLRGVIGVYRLFSRSNILDVDDQMSRPDSEVPPAEYWDWNDEFSKDDPYANRAPLDFVCTKNSAGRDAAGEARVAGHKDLAAWLDGLAARIDRDGMREDEEYMREARLEALYQHWYHDKNEKQEFQSG